MQGVSESLAGRAEIVDLEPLSVGEIRAAARDTSVEAMILRGGFPELYEKPELDSFSYYRSYIATCLDRDVRTLLNVSSLRDFERFIRACALRSGKLLNKADLARDVGISPSTANQWLSILESSGQVFLLEPWFSNKIKSIVKSPKMYLADTGLLTALLNIQNTEELLRSPLVGSIWETAVFAELRKREQSGPPQAISFWHDRKRELDFLIDRGGRFELFDAKWTARPAENDLVVLEDVSLALGRDHVKSRAIVCRTPNRHPLGKSVQAVPIHEL
jgi:hypothetical protein